MAAGGIALFSNVISLLFSLAAALLYLFFKFHLIEIVPGKELVTCGSAVKLSHFESSSSGSEQYFLNSESKNLGTGSGQQIVTAIANPSTTNTLWWIRGPKP